MTRRQAGRKAKQRGDAWESEIVSSLTAWTAAGRVHGWQKHGIPGRWVKRGTRMVFIPEAGSAPVDLLVWGPNGTHLFEAKHSSKPRWLMSELKAHQALNLSSWESPVVHRHAAVALRWLLPTGHRSAYLVPWWWLRPRWERWAAGDAGRGEASLSYLHPDPCWVPWSRAFRSES